MENEFLKNPIYLDILGVNLKSEPHFYVKNRVIFLGNIPSEISKELHKTKDKTKNKTKDKLLESYYGERYDIFEKTGGEDDIFDITPDLPDKKIPILSKTLDKTSDKTLESDKIKFVENIHIYPEDRISEFREKIYLSTGIPIYKQHIFSILDEFETSKKNEQIIPIKYKIVVDGAINIDIRKLFEMVAGNKILDIPVDTNLFQNREYMQVESLEYFTTLSDLYENFGIRKYILINIDEFINPIRNLLRDMLINDVYQFQLLYYGFVIKYWPIMTLEVFNAYITDENDIKNSYPDLALSLSYLNNKYEEEKKILDFKYTLLEDAVNGYKKYPDFKKYRPEFSILSSDISKDSVMGVAIKSATLSNLTIDSWSGNDISSQIKINVRNLFGQYSTDNNVPLIKARLLVNGKIITLTKIKAPSIIESDPDDIQKVYEKIKYRIQMPYYNTILFAIKIPDSLSGHSKSENIDHNYLILNIYDNGKYSIKSIWDEEIQMDFRKIYNIVEKTINTILEKINNLGRAIFESVRKINIIKRNNTEFSSLHMSIFWKMPMTRTTFDKIYDLIKEDMNSQIIKPMDGLIESTESGNYNYYIVKGITEYDTKQLERSVNVVNYYEYLSNARIKQKWVSLFEKGRSVNINHRTADIKIEIQGLKEKEFTNFYQYIISFLYRAEKNIKKSNVVDTVRKTKISNINKLLKSRDPELYIFKRFGSDVVFSRICQKGHQPVPYLPEEYINLDEKTKNSAVNYWNFTTKSPMYYVCPDKKYPYLNFLIGHHPKGYCLPCCKKTLPYEYELTKQVESTDKTTKKEHIYNVCMQQYIYTEKDTQLGPSRYIMNYGKPIDIGRIGKLPDIIDRYLLYNLEDKEILEVSERTITGDFGFGTNLYSVNLLWKLTKNNKIFEEPISKYRIFLENKNWSGQPESFNAIEIINDPNLSPDHFNRISNADLAYPIIVYEDTKKDIFEILDGIHRIAKIILESSNVNVKVRYATRKQLEKSIIKPDIQIKNGGIQRNQIIGGGIKKPGYYLYGVPQNNINVSNIGAGYAIAAALNLNFNEFIQKTINYLVTKTKTNYFKILLKGKLGQYFSSMDNLVMIMTKLFLDENLDIIISNNRFYLWNELFVDIARMCFSKYVIILDDISIDITGTSIKTAKITENINIILPERIIHVDDIIPQCDKNNIVCEKSNQKFSIEYILLLRKKKKSKSFFDLNRLYYPIFIFIPQIFFKTLNIEKKIFTYKDEVIKLVRNILLESLSDQKINTNYNNIILQQEIDIKVILLFINYIRINKECYLYRILANSKNMCYAVLLNIEIKKNKMCILYFPVKYSYFDNIPNTYFEKNMFLPEYVMREPFSRTIISDCSYDIFKLVIEEYNTFVIEESEKQGLFKIIEEKKYKSKMNQRESRILPIYPLIRLNQLLILDNKPQNAKIIGMESSGIFYYFSELVLTKDNLHKIYNKYTSDYNLLEKDIEFDSITTIIKYLHYDPDIINKTIYNYNMQNIKTLPDRTSYYKSIYNKYLYNLYVLEIMSYLDNDRDENLRSEIISIVSKTNFKDVNQFEETKVKLDKILEFPDDFVKIQDQINLYLTSHFDKKLLISELNNLVYQFDRVSLLKLQNMSENYYKNTPEEKEIQKNKMTKYIEKISKNIVELKEPNFTDDSILGNIFIPCSASEFETGYCNNKNRKLLISEEKLKIIIDIFISDIVNPIKRQYLLSSILISNIQNYFQFEKKDNEEIYVKFN